MSIEATLFLDSGLFCFHVVRQAALIFEAIEKSGLHGGEPGKSRVVRHQHIHDPGIQQEPSSLLTAILRGGRCGFVHPSPRSSSLAIYARKESCSERHICAR